MLLKTATNANITNANLVGTEPTGEAGAYLAAGGEPCIGVQLVNRAVRTDGSGTYTPAHIKLTPHNTNRNNNVCQQVLGSQAVSDYLSSSVPGTAADPITAAIPVGSTKGIYRART